MAASRANLIAASWAFAEATAFFIVPDVWLSWLALRDTRRACVACLYAVGGALLGGWAVWWSGAANADALRGLYVALPAIDQDMIASVESQLDSAGLFALFVGPTTGTPYKLYALEAGSRGIGLAEFLAVSLPARLLRFLLVALASGAVALSLRRWLTMQKIQLIHLLSWSVFYSWFFYVMSSSP